MFVDVGVMVDVFWFMCFLWCLFVFDFCDFGVDV